MATLKYNNSGNWIDLTISGGLSDYPIGSLVAILDTTNFTTNSSATLQNYSKKTPAQLIGGTWAQIKVKLGTTSSSVETVYASSFITTEAILESFARSDVINNTDWRAGGIWSFIIYQRTA